MCEFEPSLCFSSFQNKHYTQRGIDGQYAFIYLIFSSIFEQLKLKLKLKSLKTTSYLHNLSQMNPAE